MGHDTIGTVKGRDRRTSHTPRPPGPTGQLLLGRLRDLQREQVAISYYDLRDVWEKNVLTTA